MITTLLIANRGEIARRVIATASAMGITTVAVYAEGDAGAPYVTEADRAVALPGRTAAETYLNIGALLAAASAAGADAVHPGYGFLSERAGFARAVTGAGLTWVGPPAEAIEAMGDKLAAKRLMADVGVPVLPSWEVAGDTVPGLDGLPLPVIVKAAAGGGGKGMRVVGAEPAGAGRAGRGDVAAAQREVAAAFRGRHGVPRGRLRHRCQARGDPDPRRHPRRGRALLRTRVLDPAPPSEDHRGVPLARPADGELPRGVGLGAARAWPP